MTGTRTSTLTWTWLFVMSPRTLGLMLTVIIPLCWSAAKRSGLDVSRFKALVAFRSSQTARTDFNSQ